MSIHEPKKSSRGRPSVDSEQLRARVERPVIEALDAWAAAEDMPEPRRPEAMRRALAQHLRSIGFLKDGASQ